MFTATARPATEKADFRPALPLLLNAGLLPEKMMSAYLEKLKDPRWQKMRLQILERDEWQCQDCYDDKKTLHVHHRYYERGLDPWEYPPHSLVTLCEDCHSAETESLSLAEKRLIVALKKAGADSGQIDMLASAFEMHEDIAVRERSTEFGVIRWHIESMALGLLGGTEEYESIYRKPALEGMKKRKPFQP